MSANVDTNNKNNNINNHADSAHTMTAASETTVSKSSLKQFNILYYVNEIWMDNIDKNISG